MGIIRQIKRFFYTPYSALPPISNAAGFAAVLQKNRKTLEHVPNWLDETAMAASCFQYGVPELNQRFINEPLSMTPTYSDYIAYFSQQLKEPICYLEIGVSVGKNFFQMLNTFDNAELTGFEIEDINPPLRAVLKEKETKTWDKKPDSIKKSAPILSQYSFDKTGNKVTYLCADVFDEASWERLKGRKFNLLFSDAFHDAASLLHEYKMMQKYDLIADNFMFFWDDLHFDMEDAFVEIAQDLGKKRGFGKETTHLFKTSGWIGDNEPPHPIGLVTNISIK
jgi:hypothetical protein